MSFEKAHANSGFRLIATPRSPFARRIRLALVLREIDCEIQMTDVFNPSAEFLAANPLALVPVLFDPVISEWVPDSDTQLDILDESPILASRGVKPIWPVNSNLRPKVRVRSRWATGVMTATVAHFLERIRAASDPSVLSEHESVIRKTLEQIAQDVLASPEFWQGKDGPTQAGWDLGVALDYLELRLPEMDWRSEWSDLVQVRNLCDAHPIFRDTRPPAA
jgi:glutathione S-transferase